MGGRRVASVLALAVVTATACGTVGDLHVDRAGTVGSVGTDAAQPSTGDVPSSGAEALREETLAGIRACTAMQENMLESVYDGETTPPDVITELDETCDRARDGLDLDRAAAAAWHLPLATALRARSVDVVGASLESRQGRPFTQSLGEIRREWDEDLNVEAIIDEINTAAAAAG
ncbi:MAG: hypothetical protein S0880_21960 [Actinomycetota bacterium]|nr:hypothetical protein [Actinomycetota bacterium]